MVVLTKLTTARLIAFDTWSFISRRLYSPTSTTGQVREVLRLTLDKGFAAQSCVAFNSITSDGGTQAAQAAWQAVLPVLQYQRPTFVVVQSSANHQAASAAVRLVDAQLKALSGSTKEVPPVIGFSVRPWLPEGQSTAASRLTHSQCRLERHVRITAAVLPDAEAASFHTVTDSFPKIPNLEAALTTRPPHALLFPHPSYTDDQLSSLITRLESGFQGAEVLGLVPLPPLPDQDTETAKKQLEIFRNEAASILGEANAAGDLAAPLAVAAAEAEALTLDQLEGPSEEGSRGEGQEEAAIFSGDTSFMQGAVGLTLMPPTSGDRVPLKDLAALSCFLFGTDKSYGLFMSADLKHLVYSARNQQSKIAPPDGSDEDASPFLTAEDLDKYLSRNDESLIVATGTDNEASDSKLASSIPSFDQGQGMVQPETQSLQGQAAPQLGDAAPVSSLGAATAAGSQPLPASSQPAAVFAQDWKPAQVTPAGLMSVIGPSQQTQAAMGHSAGATRSDATGSDATETLQDAAARESEYTSVQTDGQLPLFALQSVLWPNQLMMLRAFEPRYTRLIRCCQSSQGCFGLASMGVGITAMFDRVQAEDDGSYSVTLRGGRRFLIQEGTAQVVPGTFGLTAVQPHYIYYFHVTIRHIFACMFGWRFLVQDGTAQVVPGAIGLTADQPRYIYDTDLNSPEAAMLAAEAAELLTRAHLQAQLSKTRPGEEQPEDAASRWREGVLEDAGASSAFAGAFNVATPKQQQALPHLPVRTAWSPAAAQELSFLLGSALPVPPTLRRKWLRMQSLTKRLQQQVELLHETRPRLILGSIVNTLPKDSRFHELLYKSDVVSS